MRATLVAFVLWLVASAAHATPLDLSDPTPRSVLFQVEDSPALEVVASSFGGPLPASYSVSAGVGRILISPAIHEQMRPGTPVPGTYSSILIEIELATGEASSAGGSGQVAFSPSIGIAFSQNALSTLGTAGFVTNFGGLFCPSQQWVDDACVFAPPFCGETCVLVPGAAYDAATGNLNLVGSEHQSGCDGAVCSEADFFTPLGDLKLSESAPVPALPLLAWALLAAGLAATVGARRPGRSAGSGPG